MNNEAPQATPNTNTGGRRRSSGFMPAFASLHEQKRGPDNAERRASLSDQQSKGGIFSQIFHNNFGKNAPK